MQITFVLTIIIGAPVVTLLSLAATLPTWGAHVEFAIRVGAMIWIITAVSVFSYAHWSDTDTNIDMYADVGLAAGVGIDNADTDAVSTPSLNKEIKDNSSRIQLDAD
jgi:hypothetical protein